MERLRTALDDSVERDSRDILLIGRRDLRSNNSWMHNLHVLTKGKARCTLHIHPDDAARMTLADGETATVTSHAGTVELPIEITDAIMPGLSASRTAGATIRPEPRCTLPPNTPE